MRCHNTLKFFDVLALNNKAAATLKFPFEYNYTDGCDLQVVLCLSQHVNCTINWKPFSVMLVTDTVRQQVKHLFKRTVKDGQYTVKGDTSTFVVAQIFSFTLTRYAIFTFFTGFFVTFSVQVFIAVNFRLFDVTLYVFDVAWLRMCWCGQVPFGWKLTPFVCYCEMFGLL